VISPRLSVLAWRGSFFGTLGHVAGHRFGSSLVPFSVYFEVEDVAL